MRIVERLVSRLLYCRKYGHFPIVARVSPRVPVYYCYCIYCGKQFPLWDIREDLRMKVWR